ncbi:MAG: TIGR03936 family radical SAM-associated protein [Moorellales bacterium]
MLYLINYAQRGPARFVSHLEVSRALERALRRAGLPLKLSQGFNPRPYLSFALPLPVGMSGRSELAVVELSQALPATEVQARLAAEMPPGFALKLVHPLAPGTVPSAVVVAALYRARPGWEPYPSRPELERAVVELLNRPFFTLEAKGQNKDVRPGILDLRVRGGAKSSYLILFLAAGSQRYLRPELALSALAQVGGWKEERPPVLERLGLFGCRGRHPVPLGALLTAPAPARRDRWR